LKVLIQRVSRASVRVAGETVGAIDRGLLVFLGVEEGDEVDDAVWNAAKTAELRIFPDDEARNEPKRRGGARRRARRVPIHTGRVDAARAATVVRVRPPNPRSPSGCTSGSLRRCASGVFPWRPGRSGR
jgi:D-tyrosyl-tRNA(Tyr) deacylase